MSVCTIHNLQKESSVLVGDVGIKFFHGFCCNIYAGEVVKIKQNSKRKFRFNDGELEDYSLPQLQKMYKKVYVVKDASSIGSEYEESDSKFEQRSAVGGAIGNNYEVIPDVD